ncbi:TetR/AcrR family transcriptional regulator [Anaerocolumna sp. AGMB13020]|uniref:TetR/AcrR family transcriptional regulator n=1 Tax=Anaerocolumna sp. AGMB13020 TaxID=3081750 RepID=UPI00295529DB|nr:TetR/AcrR family transcriptional regulator [Anaerocolumna sp. AGMB13020]WOO37669.1 TetR/AcrR family transcriptional regulator [Anaerocolumna sp. AGMB13020]
MPKSYSEQEKEHIKKRLKEEAAKCLAQFGIRKTTVDEIVKRVKIPKGTFYLFYKSKELLLFDVILEQHDAIEQQMMIAFSDFDLSSGSTEQLANVLFEVFKIMEQNPILKILNSDEIEVLARKLPGDILANHLEHDQSMVEEIFSRLPVKPQIDINSCTAAFRAIYFATLHREGIGEQHYDLSLRLLIQGLLIQMF